MTRDCQVEASDLGASARSSDVSVIVRVIDVNDNAPVICVNTLSAHTVLDLDVDLDSPTPDSLHRAVVSENIRPGSFVAHISVSDSDDLPRNRRVGCDVTSRDSAFQLTPRHHNEYQASHLFTYLLLICYLLTT